jgi:hypothetical protein
MNRRILGAFLVGASIATLSLSTPARAVLETIEEAYELALLQVRMPASSGDSVVIRKCGTCEPVRLRTNANTTYHVGHGTPPVPLAEMNRTIASITDRDSAAIVVFYEPESLVVTRVMLSFASR